ncbi:hypothetical protein XENOCAPTIV_030936 [Xenoophorus captivus]|uniref:Secreted protein n=1 Tax=Xenoophorus captivus TaxID=1517983 RepID=A0ABV0S1F6_9TELE
MYWPSTRLLCIIWLISPKYGLLKTHCEYVRQEEGGGKYTMSVLIINFVFRVNYHGSSLPGPRKGPTLLSNKAKNGAVYRFLSTKVFLFDFGKKICKTLKLNTFVLFEFKSKLLALFII